MSNVESQKIAVIGDLEVVQIFRAIGCDVYGAETSDETRDLILEFKKEDTKEKYGIVLVLESLLEGLGEEDYAKINEGALPAILAIPSPNQASTYSATKLKTLTEQALGSDILS